jgi:hypothetical protein
MDTANVWCEELIEAEREAAPLVFAQDFPDVLVTADVVFEREAGGRRDGHAGHGQACISMPEIVCCPCPEYAREVKV